MSTLAARVEDALAAAARLRTRPLAETIAALAAAAGRWRSDAGLAAALPEASGLSPPMVAAVLPLAAAALDEGAMTALVEREWGPGAPVRRVPERPALVAHVLASNVPALALPAIALSCLTGAAAVVRSGRDDPLSAPAFVDALADVDADLAATVVAAGWPRQDPAGDAVLARAAVVVASGGDAALAALAARLPRPPVAHGPRWSVVALGRAALEQVAPLADAIALDVSLHDQRGCLSPHVVFVEDGGACPPRAFSEQLAAALAATARRLPLGPAGLAARSTQRLACAEAEWEADTTVLAVEAGTVLYEDTARFRPTWGRRTVRVQPLSALAALPHLLPAGQVECVGLAGADPRALAEPLRGRGVSRICPPGRMQQPPLSWPRGQLSPLGTLRGEPGPPRLEVEP